MTILDKIVAHPLKESAKSKSLHPILVLEQSPLFAGVYSLHLNKSGIIAEFKH